MTGRLAGRITGRLAGRRQASRQDDDKQARRMPGRLKNAEYKFY
jgi:hypothetical protein